MYLLYTDTLMDYVDLNVSATFMLELVYILRTLVKSLLTECGLQK